MAVNVNIDDIKKMASLLTGNIQNPVKQVKIATPTISVPAQVTNSSENNDQIISLGAGESQIINVERMIVVMGYSLPVHTFYLIIFLFILGLVIWYLNSDYRKSKKKIIDNKDSQEDNTE
jgi:hypothetical protein